MPQSVEKSMEEALELLQGNQDTESGVQTIIDYAHHEVHEGRTWLFSYPSGEGGDIGDNATIEILIRVGALCHADFVFEAAAGGDFEIELFEAPTITNDGAELFVVNLKRSAVGPSNTLARLTPTVSDDGLRILNTFVPGGQKNQAQGGVARPGTEWGLKTDTDYLLRLINRAGSAKPMAILGQWYDHEDHA